MKSDLRRGRVISNKCQLDVVDDSVHHREISEEGDDAHLTMEFGKRQEFPSRVAPNPSQFS